MSFLDDCWINSNDFVAHTTVNNGKYICKSNGIILTFTLAQDWKTLYELKTYIC